MRGRLVFYGALLLAGGGLAVAWWKMKLDQDEFDSLVAELADALPFQAGRYAQPIARAAMQTAPSGVGARAWAYVLAAIMMRESRGGDALSPRGPTGTGDGGHGRGLMQIDDRYHEFARTGQWQDPAANVLFAASLLRDLYGQANGDLGRAVAAYNAGPKAIAASDPDSVTTGRNYSASVLGNAATWAPEGVFA